MFISANEASNMAWEARHITNYGIFCKEVNNEIELAAKRGCSEITISSLLINDLTTEEQKKYIEENIDLIETKNWKKFFKDPAEGVGGVLYEAGIDWMKELPYIPSCAFKRHNIKEVVIPNNVTRIGMEAFDNCTNLKSITIPDSVTSIWDYAFYNCRSLTSITIPDSVTSIGKQSFAFSESLKNVTIPGSITSISLGAFQSCARLTTVKILDGVTNIHHSAFDCCYSLTNVTIPDSVTSIGGNAFAHCTRLTSIVIPNSVTSIDIYAFRACESLTSITIPKSVTSIGEGVFEHCNKLEIKYNGTVDEWKNLVGNKSLVLRSDTYKCRCIDGVVKKS